MCQVILLVLDKAKSEREGERLQSKNSVMGGSVTGRWGEQEEIREREI